MKRHRFPLPKWLTETTENHVGWEPSAGELASIMQDAYRFSGNPAEAELHKELLDQGALVLRRGWPDFAVFWPDGFQAIEVKDHGDQVRPSQSLILRGLQRLGVSSSIFRRKGEGRDAWTQFCPCCGGGYDPWTGESVPIPFPGDSYDIKGKRAWDASERRA